jgi:hypothetical protein
MKARIIFNEAEFRRTISNETVERTNHLIDSVINGILIGGILFTVFGSLILQNLIQVWTYILVLFIVITSICFLSMVKFFIKKEIYMKEEFK